MTGADLARAAQDLIGAPFRLHGRDPASGLDCVGLLGAAMARCGQPINLPTGYTLRLSDPAPWLLDPAILGYATASAPILQGDVVLLQLGAAQFHLAIAAALRGWIHAHAGLRRVVLTPQLPEGRIAHHWRRAPTA